MTREIVNLLKLLLILTSPIRMQIAPPEGGSVPNHGVFFLFADISKVVGIHEKKLGHFRTGEMRLLRKTREFGGGFSDEIFVCEIDLQVSMRD